MKNIISKSEGYALISQEYLQGEGENYHIFPAYLTNKYINNSISIKIINNKCKKRPLPRLYGFEKLSHRTIFFIDLNNLRTIKLKGGKHDYYVGYNKNVYYFEDKITAKMVIASFTNKEVFVSCMSMLYGSKDN